MSFSFWLLGFKIWAGGFNCCSRIVLNLLPPIFLLESQISIIIIKLQIIMPVKIPRPKIILFFFNQSSIRAYIGAILPAFVIFAIKETVSANLASFTGFAFGVVLSHIELMITAITMRIAIRNPNALASLAMGISQSSSLFHKKPKAKNPMMIKMIPIKTGRRYFKMSQIIPSEVKFVPVSSEMSIVDNLLKLLDNI